MRTVLITDANRGSALALIRSLGRQGWQVVAGDERPRSTGFYSRFTAHHFVYPSPADSDQAFVAAIYRAANRFGVDLIIPVTDDTILPLAAARAEFEPECRLAVAPAEALEKVLDKCATLQLGQRLHVPTPQTFVVHSPAEASDVAPMLPWPLVLKATRSRRYLPGRGVEKSPGVAYADNVEELQAHVRRFMATGPVMLQPYYSGRGEGVEMLAYEGRPLAVFQHRRLAEVPVTGGASALREGVPLDDELYRYSRRLVRALSWTGLIMVEFKVGEGGPLLMEINGRVWGSLPLAVHSGMDFPARLSDLYRNGPPPSGRPPAKEYRPGVKVYNLDLMLLWVAQVLRGRHNYSFLPYPRRRAAIGALLGMADLRRKYDMQMWSDPLPGLLQIGQVVHKLASKSRGEVH